MKLYIAGSTVVAFFDRNHAEIAEYAFDFSSDIMAPLFTLHNGASPYYFLIFYYSLWRQRRESPLLLLADLDKSKVLLGTMYIP